MMSLTRRHFNVKTAQFGEKCELSNGVLTISKSELKQLCAPLLKAVSDFDLEIVSPGEDARIVHVLDSILPMIKPDGSAKAHSGFFGSPETVGSGSTNLLSGFAVIESAALPWEEGAASSGLLYPRDAILDMCGPIAGYTPFSQMTNLVIVYTLAEGNSSLEYDENIRLIGLKISEHLAALTLQLEPDSQEVFSNSDINPELPNVVLVWQCQNQGPYSNTLLYGLPINDIVPTLLHPNEMLDGCVVSGNYVWPAFKVPSYLHANHPILLRLYREHGKTLNFSGVVFCRSHNPSNWHKERCANMVIKLSQYVGADGLIMAWEGGGNAAVDGMLTIAAAEHAGIKTSTVTFEFGGADGTEGMLLVDDVPENDACVSGGSIEKHNTLPKVARVVGGEVMRLNKESGGYFPDAHGPVTFDTTTHFYLGGNQCAYSKICGEAY